MVSRDQRWWCLFKGSFIDEHNVLYRMFHVNEEVDRKKEVKCLKFYTFWLERLVELLDYRTTCGLNLFLNPIR